MKKILFLAAISLLISCNKNKDMTFRGNAIDSANVVTTISATDYIPIFNDSPKEMSRAYADYVFPWSYSSGLVIPRSTATNVVIGGTANTWSNDLYVVGTSRTGGNHYTMGRHYFGVGGVSYVQGESMTNQLSFYDPITGSKTLAQLATGGTSFDLTLVTNKSVVTERGDTAYGSANLTYDDTTLVVKSVAPYSVLIGEEAGAVVTSTSVGNVFLGSYSGNTFGAGANGNVAIGYRTGSDRAAGDDDNVDIGYEAGRYASGGTNTNIGSGSGYRVTGSGNVHIGYRTQYNAISTSTHSNQLFINNNAGDKFAALIWGDFANDSIRLNGKVVIKDSLIMEGYHPVTRYSYTYIDSITQVMRVDSTVLGAKYGLEIKRNIHDLLSDTVNGEIPWYLSLEEVTHNLDTLKPNEKIRVLVAANEYAFTQIAELEKRIDELEFKTDFPAKVNSWFIVISAFFVISIALVAFKIGRK